MSMSALNEVAVVGGGPAGATIAFLLACRGFEVTLFDRQHFPRPKLCAGLLTRKTIRLLEELFGENAESLKRQGIITQTCSDYRVVRRRVELARGRLEYPFHLVDRTRYDHLWIEKARRAGVRLRLGLAVVRVEPDGRLFTADGGVYRFDVIVGADGVNSRLRRCMWTSRGDRRRWRSRLAGAIETRYPAAPGKPCATLYFGYAPWGYAWSFPNPRSNVVGICGLGRRKRKPSLKAAFGRFLADWGMAAFSDVEWQSHPLPYGNFLSKPARDRLLLIGDACGLADPLLGEGIFFAHRSAQAAALAITDCRNHPADLAARYGRWLNRMVLREFRWIAFYRWMLFFGGRLRRFTGLRLLLKFFPARLEALVQGTRPYSRLFFP